MSYAVTEAGEQDMRAELKVIEQLNEEIDQLASEAPDCGTLAPEVKDLLNLAWFFTERAYLEAHGRCSAHSDRYCACCAHYNELKGRAARIKGVL